MSSLLHDVRRRSPAVRLRCTLGHDLAVQLPGTAHESPTGAAPLSGTGQRAWPAARVRVSSDLTDLAYRRLAILLDSMITAGHEQVIVHLAGAGMVDAALLQVLRVAQRRLAGGLTVVADRAGSRLPLTLVGLDGRRWAGRNYPGTGVSHARG